VLISALYCQAVCTVCTYIHTDNFQGLRFLLICEINISHAVNSSNVKFTHVILLAIYRSIVILSTLNVILNLLDYISKAVNSSELKLANVILGPVSKLTVLF
jgi:hypothetical protein